MKPHIHAQNSARLFGGKSDDYIDIHQWFDATKEHFPDNRHRALRHHTQGIFEAERVFGKVKINSDGKEFSVRDIGEQHVQEDLGFIPTVHDYLQHLELQDWMCGKGRAEKPKTNPPKIEDIIVDGSSPSFKPITIPPTEFPDDKYPIFPKKPSGWPDLPQIYD